MNLIIIPIIVILWLIAGQCWKPARRLLIPAIATLYALFFKDRRKRWLCSILLFLGFILSLGYGENSDIRKALGGSDFWTRIILGILVASIPITYSLVSSGFNYRIFIILVLNVISWQVHAGSLFKIGKYDILIEDICRATALGVSITIM